MIEINLLPKEYRKKTFDFSLGKVGVYAVDQIAKLAGVNKATIYYHIGDKQALYAQVITESTAAPLDNPCRRFGPA